MSVDGSVPLWKEHSTQTEREREIPSGKRLHSENHNFFMGKLTISMAISHSYVKLPEGK